MSIKFQSYSLSCHDEIPTKSCLRWDFHYIWNFKVEVDYYYDELPTKSCMKDRSHSLYCYDQIPLMAPSNSGFACHILTLHDALKYLSLRNGARIHSSWFLTTSSPSFINVFKSSTLKKSEWEWHVSLYC